VDLNNQSYFRQAMMSSVDQASLIKHVDNGYAVPTYSAIPTYPKNSNNKGVKNTWSYSTTRGKTIMKAHGWNTNVFPDVCARVGAAGCGNAQYPIPVGSKASETVLIPSGDQPPITLAQDQANEIKAASGIQMKVDASLTPNQVQTDCFGAQQGAWEICGYGGWIFSPDYYPSGEVLFVLGSSSNAGGYPSAEMLGLMADTTTSGNIALNGNNPKYHTSYAQFSATDVPFLWQPTPAGFIEQLKAMKGNPAPSPLTNFNPEYITSI
jgi:peptide/nickel transport system substrate-binding protein